MKCNGEEDVALCLHQAADSATSVTLDLNQLTLAQPEHLEALRYLCVGTYAHVTLTNGTIVLGGSDGMLSINNSRLTFKSMEIVRLPPNEANPMDIIANMAGHLYAGLDGPASGSLSSWPVKHGAQVELHDCRADLVFGMHKQLEVTGAGSKLSLHGCTLVEEEGSVQPPASSFTTKAVAPVSVMDGAALVLADTRVRMPLGTQLGQLHYTIDCSTGSTLTATASTFEGSCVVLSRPATGCRITSCSFSGCRSTPTCFWDAKCFGLALVSCLGASDVVIQDCTFTHAPDRVAIMCADLPRPLPLEGGPPLVHIKACTIVNCLHGIEVPMPDLKPGEPKWRLTVEVEDTTVELAPTPAAPDYGQACVLVGGPAVSVTVRRCVIKASGGDASRAVAVLNGARLAMADCTVTLQGFASAVVVEPYDGLPPVAIIERTTMTAGLTGGATPSSRSASAAPQGQPLMTDMVCTQDGTIKLIDCRIQGSDSHCGVTIKGPGKAELVRCDIAAEQPMLKPWAVHDPKGTIILKDCTVGKCDNDVLAGVGTFHILDNTPYLLWTDGGFPAHTQPPNTRQIIYTNDAPPGHQLGSTSDNASFFLSSDRPEGCLGQVFMTYVTDERHSAQGAAEPQGSRGMRDPKAGGPNAEGRRTESTRGSAPPSGSAGVEGGSRAPPSSSVGMEGSSAGVEGSNGAPTSTGSVGGSSSASSSGSDGKVQHLVAPGGFWWPNRCHCCAVPEQVLASARCVMPWCQGCTCVRFCSVECQKRSWSAHKPLCQYISQHYGQATGGTKVPKGK